MQRRAYPVGLIIPFLEGRAVGMRMTVGCGLGYNRSAFVMAPPATHPTQEAHPPRGLTPESPLTCAHGSTTMQAKDAEENGDAKRCETLPVVR